VTLSHNGTSLTYFRLIRCPKFLGHYKERIHLHHFEDQWAELERAVDDFLNSIADRASAVLRYVGLTDPIKLYTAALAT
jgi:hypothetical protein